MVLDSTVGKSLNFMLDSDQLFACYRELEKKQASRVRLQVPMEANMKMVIFGLFCAQ
jgi:hypothetical protein